MAKEFWGCFSLILSRQLGITGMRRVTTGNKF